MKNIKNNNPLHNASISDILAYGEKPKLAGLTSCADALQHLKAQRAQAALVQNSLGHFMGIVTQQALKNLDKTEQTAPVDTMLECVADICTPTCNAQEICQRLEQNQSPYVLVVNTSGKLLSFLEPRDFHAITGVALK